MQATYPDTCVMFARFLFHTESTGNERKNETFSMKMLRASFFYFRGWQKQRMLRKGESYGGFITDWITGTWVCTFG